MKPFATRSRPPRSGRARRPPPPGGDAPGESSLGVEMAQGALVGFLAASIFTFLVVGEGLTAMMFMSFASLGLFFGGVIGVILWVGSAALPEDAILTPAPGQARGRRPPPRTPRRQR